MIDCHYIARLKGINTQHTAHTAATMHWLLSLLGFAVLPLGALLGATSLSFLALRLLLRRLLCDCIFLLFFLFLTLSDFCTVTGDGGHRSIVHYLAFDCPPVLEHDVRQIVILKCNNIRSDDTTIFCLLGAEMAG